MTVSRTLLASSSIALLVLTAGASPGQEGPRSIVVGLQPGGDASAFANELGLVLEATMPGLPYARMRPAESQGAVGMEQLVRLLDTHPATRFAELDFMAELPEVSGCGVGGPATMQQCTLGFVDGSPSPEGYENQAWMLDIRLPQAQALSIGRPSLVAVLDTGIDYDHPALAGRIDDRGYDFVLDQPGAAELRDGIDNDGDGLVDEGFGHGTHVAGIVAIVNPHATILPLRVMDSDGNGTAWNVAEGVFYALSAGADIVNLSLSFQNHSQLVADMLHLVITAGVDVFTSAGNTGAELVLFPGNLASDADTLVPLPPIYPYGVACVTAVDARDRLAGFAAFGAQIDVCAPGVGIRSSYPGGYYANWSGTSMGCAVAAGIASLCQSAAVPRPFPPGVDLVVNTAVSIDAANPGQAGNLGAGRVDALAAVQAAQWH